MTRADAIKLGILVFLIFILCLPEFFPQVPQIHFLCEMLDPCTPEDVSHVCGKANPPCVAEMRNSSSQDRPRGWYLCKTEKDSHVLNNNTSVSGQHVLVVLTLKGDNNSEWNVSVFINHTDLYTGPQNPQRLFYCFLPPNKSKCPDMNTEEHTKENSPRRPVASLKTTTSAKPVTSSLKKEMSSTQKLNCQLPSSGYLFHYQENNQTARSAAFLRTQTKHESWWSMTTGVWIILVLTLVIVALTSVGCLVYKNRRKSHLVTVSARDYQLKEISKQRGNLTRNAPDAFTVCSVDDNVFFNMMSTTEDRADENLLMVNVPYNRQLSPIYEITENSRDEDCDEGEEEEEADDLVTKQEFKESQGLSGQTSAHLHRRSNPSCSCHETDGEL